MPERVVSLAQQVSHTVNDKVRQIGEVTKMTKILSINALIEAARAGEQGKGFAVVAQEVGSVTDEIKQLSESLTRELAPQVKQLDDLGRQLVAQVRGGRLADLSLNMIDIIDRNLYERSCDVRWWATDSAVVDACEHPSDDAARHASSRLGVILDAYTVYLDLWIADRTGRVIANGRPNRYPSVIGTDVSTASWFRNAMGTRSGDDYVVDDVDVSHTLDNATVATYATAVRQGGGSRGAVVGALGIFFDWAPQADGVVRSVRISDGERDRTRCLLLDSQHRVLASSDGMGVLRERYPLQPGSDHVGYYNDDKGSVVGYALTPGYETYRGLGWYGVIEQRPATSVH
jgi:hypothetical protein